MNNENLMIFPELAQGEFDVKKMVNNPNYTTLCGLPVKIDRILRDVTQTTVVGFSGTMVIRGIKVRGVWDAYGNIIECKKTLNLLTPRQLFACVDGIFSETTPSMFQLVHAQQIEKQPQQIGNEL